MAASSTVGGTSAAPAASATVPASALSTACATFPVTDIDVATISQSQKNRAALRRPRVVSISESPPGVVGMVLNTQLRRDRKVRLARATHLARASGNSVSLKPMARASAGWLMRRK